MVETRDRSKEVNPIKKYEAVRYHLTSPVWRLHCLLLANDVLYFVSFFEMSARLYLNIDDTIKYN